MPAAAGIRDGRLHDARHTAATVLLLLGMHHRLRHPHHPDTMHAAERVGRYYLDHALAVYDLMGQSHPDLDAAREVLDWITKQCNRTGLHTISRRDALRSLHGRARFACAADLEPAFNLLEDHG